MTINTTEYCWGSPIFHGIIFILPCLYKLAINTWKIILNVNYDKILIVIYVINKILDRKVTNFIFYILHRAEYFFVVYFRLYYKRIYCCKDSNYVLHYKRNIFMLYIIDKIILYYIFNFTYMTLILDYCSADNGLIICY